MEDKHQEVLQSFISMQLFCTPVIECALFGTDVLLPVPTRALCSCADTDRDPQRRENHQDTAS